MFVGVVLNPQARKNRGDSVGRVDRLARILGPYGDVRLTATVDELGDALRDLLPRSTHLVSDGGDGALHWMINEVRAQLGDEASASWPTFVPTNGGTIDFVARKVGVRGRSDGIARALADAARSGQRPPEIELDTLALDGAYADGAAFRRIGFALAAGGVGNRFFDKYYEDPEPSAGTIVRIIARTIGEWTNAKARGSGDVGSYAEHMFRPTPARVSIDGEVLPAELHGGIHAGSFDVNLGGVIRLFPFARERGVLHLQAGEISPAGMILNLPNILLGKPVRGPRLSDAAGHEMIIEALAPDRDTGEVEWLRPILDGERFEHLQRIEVHAGPSVRVARLRA